MLTAMMTRRGLLAGLTGVGAALLSELRGYGTMKQFGNIKILFVAGFAPIVRDRDPSRKLYAETFDIPFEENAGYLHAKALEGVKHFGLWPLSQVAQSCFGKDSWPGDIPVPQACIEFEVESVEKATAELEARGYRMLVRARKEPWGQTVTRFIGPEGLLIGITFTPWMREEK